MQVTIEIKPETYAAYEQQAKKERTALGVLIGRTVDRFSPKNAASQVSLSISPQTGLPIITGLPRFSSEDVRAIEEEDDMR